MTAQLRCRPRRRAAIAAVIGAAFIALAAGTVAGCSDEQPVGKAGPADGAALYAESCASCHGEDLRGTPDGPSHLSEVYAPDHHPDEAFRSAVANGVAAHHWNFGDMEPVEGLNDDEVTAIIAYVRQQQDLHGLEPYPPQQTG